MDDDCKKIPLFNGDNFSTWSFRVETLFEAKGLFNILDSTKESNKKEDAMARSIIIQCLSDKYIEYVREKKTAKEMMDALGQVFQRKSILSKLYIKKKLLSHKLQPKTRLEDHFQIFDKLIRDLENVSKGKLEEEDKVCHLLLTLPDSYDSIVTAMETMSSELKLDFVKTRLLEFELKQVSKDESQFNIKDQQDAENMQDSSFLVCYNCGKKGHKRFECPSRRLQKYHKNGGKNVSHVAAVENANKLAFVAINENHAMSSNSNTEITFLLDSGASDHMVQANLEEFMTDIKILDTPISIFIANGESMIAKRKGRLLLQYMSTEISLEALIVPKLSANLISVNQLTRKGLEVLFVEDKAIVRSQTLKLTLNRIGKIYRICFNIKNEVNKAMKTNEADDMLWHRRMGHLSRKSLQRMSLPVSKEICSDCIKGKATRLPFTKCQFPRSNRIGELIHTDLCGPMDIMTKNGEQYFQVIIDDYSHFTQVFLLKQKNEATENIINYVNSLENQHRTKVFKIRCDNGGEFKNKRLNEFAKQKGIRLQLTMPYTSQQNGVSERMNRTLLDKARCMIADSDLSKEMWGYAIQSAAYVLNRSPTSALKGGTPSERWFGKNDLSKIKVFGCKVWYTILPKRGKFDDRAAEGRFIGYLDNGYRILNIKTKCVLCVRDVIFDESKESQKSIVCNDKKFQNNQDTSTDTKYSDLYYPSSEIESKDERDSKQKDNDESMEDYVSQDDDYYQSVEDDELEDNATSDIDNEINQEEHLENDVMEIQENVNTGNEGMLRRSTRIKRAPKRFDEYELYEAYCMFISDDPVNYEEAIKSKEWTDAIEKELNAHEKMSTWDDQDMPEGEKAIDTKWVFRTKENNVKKARLVAKGYQEKVEEPIYSPVAKLSTVRLLVSLAIQNDWKITQMDVPTAFLNGKLEKSVYIKIPQGVKNCKNKTLKLNRALYGLKESPRCWNETFNKFAENIGFTRSKHDVCLYTKKDCIMLVYVDDILITGKDVEKTIVELKLQFNTRDMGNLSTFLGITYDFEKDKVRISQKPMINKILEKFRMENCNGASTPLEQNFNVSQEEEEDIIEVPYRELIGSLMYLSIGSRPDITYAVSYLSRYLDKPNKKVWNGAKRILRYLQETKTLCMIYEKQKNDKIELVGYSDSDWAADIKDRKSVTGGVIYFYGNPVVWISKKQNCVTLSSTEAEYVAGCLIGAELIALKGIVKDITKIGVDTILHMDNQGAIKISSTYENSKRSKHIDIKYHFLKDVVYKKILYIRYVDTKKNVADILTKSLGKILFHRHKEFLRILA